MSSDVVCGAHGVEDGKAGGIEVAPVGDVGSL